MAAVGPVQLGSRLVGVFLPGDAWLAILTSHVEWAVTTSLEELDETERIRVARQLLLLLATAADGISPAQDDLLTESRQLVDAACEILGHKPDNLDTQLAAQLVIRHETMASAITKLADAAGYPLRGRTDVQDARRGAGRDEGHAEGARKDGPLHRSGGAEQRPGS
jgi:hypothetical protein